MNTFRQLSFAVSVLYIVLAASLIFAPNLIYWIFGLTSHASTDVLSRRAGMLFLGLSVIAFLGRSAKDSQHTQAFLFGTCVSMTGLIGVGIFEWLRANVGPGIWFAITIEAIVLFFFALAWHRNRTGLSW